MPLIDENHMTFEVTAINSGWFGDEKKIRTTLGPWTPNPGKESRSRERKKEWKEAIQNSKLLRTIGVVNMKKTKY